MFRKRETSSGGAFVFSDGSADDLRILLRLSEQGLRFNLSIWPLQGGDLDEEGLKAFLSGKENEEGEF